MRILVDTSILVEIDRENEDVVQLLQNCVENGDELLISTVTVAEILTGSYLRRDIKNALLLVKDLLNQFTFVDFDAEAAEIVAQLYSLLFIQKKQDFIEYADVLIAATFFRSQCDVFLTLNLKDFQLIQKLEGKVYSPQLLRKKFYT